MFNQFIDEESNERQIRILIELGFSEAKAKKAVTKYSHTESLEELVNRALEMSDDNDNMSRKSQTHQKLSLIQFSEHSNSSMGDNNPFELEIFPKCPVCDQVPVDFILFECGHKFCTQCVVKYVQANRFSNFLQVTCLQVGCHEKIALQDYIKIEPFLIKENRGPTCLKCKLPLSWHEYSLFQNACESAEFAMLSHCVKKDAQGNLLQRCPTCGIWVQKSQGCNSVTCSYCKSAWCWLCRRQCDANHYNLLNPLGCPGLGAEEFTIDQWPWHKICWKRVKTLLLYLLLYICSILIYPFFVAYIIIRRMGVDFQSYKYLKAIALFILFLLFSILAIFPGIIIFLVSKKARQYVFGI